ncbi:MAG: hypothetical protein Q9160_006670 [Pyrenula sp. 1 TL-2023]
MEMGRTDRGSMGMRSMETDHVRTRGFNEGWLQVRPHSELSIILPGILSQSESVDAIRHLTKLADMELRPEAIIRHLARMPSVPTYNRNHVTGSNLGLSTDGLVRKTVFRAICTDPGLADRYWDCFIAAGFLSGLSADGCAHINPSRNYTTSRDYEGIASPHTAVGSFQISPSTAGPGLQAGSFGGGGRSQASSFMGGSGMQAGSFDTAPGLQAGSFMDAGRLQAPPSLTGPGFQVTPTSGGSVIRAVPSMAAREFQASPRRIGPSSAFAMIEPPSPE